MPKGKPWTKKQENLLRSLLNDKKSINEITEKLEKSPEAIRVKIKRLGLEVVVDREATNYCATTSNEILPDELYLKFKVVTVQTKIDMFTVFDISSLKKKPMPGRQEHF